MTTYTDEYIQDLLRRNKGRAPITHDGRPTSDALELLNRAADIITDLMKERDSFKSRAKQHGCNVEEGDHECG